MCAGIGAVNDVDVSSLVRIHVVCLNGGRTISDAVNRCTPKICVCGDVRNEETNFFRSKRIADINRSYPSRKVGYKNDLLVEGVPEVFVGGMGTEATAALAEVERTA